MTDTAAQYRRFLASCFFVLAVVLGAWGLGDMILTPLGAPVAAALPETDYIEGLGMAPRRHFQNFDLTTDENGFRRSSTPRRTPGEFRILVLGDSVPFGSGLRNGEDWPARLEFELRSAGFAVTVLNAALAGQTAQYMRRAARYFGSRMAPDLIVVQDTGNLLALATSDRDALAQLERGEADAVAARVRDWERAFGSERAIACFNESKPAYQTLQSVTAPKAFQYAASHSPVAFQALTLVSQLHLVHDRPAAPSTPHPSACPGYLTSELVNLVRLAREARAAGIAVAIVKPAYRYTWEMALGLPFDLSTQYNPPPDFVARPAELERYLRNLDVVFSRTFEGSGVRLLDPVGVHLQRSPSPKDVHALYLNDYSHFSASGASTFAAAVAAQLADNGLLPQPTAQRPWIHPHEQAVAVDLRYRPLAPDIQQGRIAAVVLFVTVLLGLIGAACVAIVESDGRRVLLLAPAVGAFVVLSSQLLGLDLLGRAQAMPPSWLAVAALALAALVALLYRKRMKSTSAAKALLGLIVGSFVIGIALSTIVGRASESKSAIADAARTLVAWVDYASVPPRERVDTSSLYLRSLSDHVARPITLPVTATNFRRALELSDPALATLVSTRWAVAPASAVLAMLGAAYLTVLLALMALTRRIASLAVVTCIHLAAILMALPSIVTIYHALGIIVIALGLATLTLRPILAAVLVVGGGVSLYFLPPLAFWVALVAITIAAFATLKVRGFATRPAIVRAVLVLFLAASGRMLVLDRTVGNTELRTAHDANHLSLPVYYYR